MSLCVSVKLWFGKIVDCVELVSLEPFTGLVKTPCVCVSVPQVIEGNNKERGEYCL